MSLVAYIASSTCEAFEGHIHSSALDTVMLIMAITQLLH